MREIKFRAWDDNEFHYNVVPLFGNEHEGPCIIEVHPLAGFRLKPVKDIQEYTGLKDKTGKEIYEGDILAERDNLKRQGIVKYESSIGSFMVFVDGGYCHLNEGDWNRGDQLQYTEVIGNIYEAKK